MPFALLRQQLADLVQQCIFLPLHITAGLIVTTPGVITLGFQFTQFALAFEFIR